MFNPFLPMYCICIFPLNYASLEKLDNRSPEDPEYYSYFGKSTNLKIQIFILGDIKDQRGQNNPRFGGVHDLSANETSTVYLKPRMSGRYASIESLKDDIINLQEIEFYSESMRKYWDM